MKHIMCSVFPANAGICHSLKQIPACVGKASRLVALWAFILLLVGCAPMSHNTQLPDYTHSTTMSNKLVDFVLVEKSRNKMYLMKNNHVVRVYDVALGQNPIGHKVQEGDHRTPEGRYMLTYKNAQSKFYRSIRIDYPNRYDKMVAEARGVSPGGDIVIHGMPNEVGNYLGPIKPRNWTQGCVAVRNHEMADIWNLVESNTPIEIRP